MPPHVTRTGGKHGRLVVVKMARHRPASTGGASVRFAQPRTLTRHRPLIPLRREVLPGDNVPHRLRSVTGAAPAMCRAPENEALTRAYKAGGLAAGWSLSRAKAGFVGLPGRWAAHPPARDRGARRMRRPLAAFPVTHSCGCRQVRQGTCLPSRHRPFKSGRPLCFLLFFRCFSAKR